MSLVLTRFVDCENNSESLESIIKRLLLVDLSTGDLYLRVAVCDETICPTDTGGTDSEPETPPL